MKLPDKQTIEGYEVTYESKNKGLSVVIKIEKKDKEKEDGIHG